MASPDSLIGTEFHGFVVTRALQTGGMGCVYEAEHPLIRRRCAVKVLRPELCDRSDLKEQFLLEARAMSAVKHRNVVEIHNFGQLPSGRAYLTMELIEGETLAEIIEREAPMQPLRALQLMEEIFSGLAAAHAVGVVHRDLKPSNIVLMRETSGDLTVKVLDFGLARLVDVRASHAELPDNRAGRISLVAGTPEYMSPEQTAGKSVDGRSDLYAAGVILFEMLTGHLPFESENTHDLLSAHASAVPPLVSSWISDVHPQLDALVDQLLGKDPKGRAESAKTARTQVKDIEAAISAAPLAVTPLLGPLFRVVAPKRKKKRFPLRAAGLGVIVASASALALSFTTLERAAPSPIFDAQPTETGRSADLVPSDSPAFVPAADSIDEVPVVAPAPAKRSKRRAVHAKPKTAVIVTCTVNGAWRTRQQLQVERLEQLSIAAIPDSAPPSAVASIRSRARRLAASVASADSVACPQVESQLIAWKAALR